MSANFTPQAGDFYVGDDGKSYVYNEGKRKFSDVYNSKPRPNMVIRNYRGWDISFIPDDLRYDGSSSKDSLDSKEFKIGGISSGKLSSDDAKTVRYPKDILDENTDYVIFQFAKYIPPFSRERITKPGGGISASGAYVNYNASISKLTAEDVFVNNVGKGSGTRSIQSIILPVPQDLSTEQKQDWQSKSFTRLGAAAVAAVGGGSFSNTKQAIGDVSGNLKAIKDAITTTGLNAIPGVGGNLTFNDITGSTRGVILNPNAELLYNGPSIREIGMVFKMVPMNYDESIIIKQICDAFRTASLPTFGGKGAVDIGKIANGRSLSETNFIRVPLLCKFTFMRGTDRHPFLAQYKPCGIAQVEINYTPDGTYATYKNGSPVATEISLKFVETKLIFSSEIGLGF